MWHYVVQLFVAGLMLAGFVCGGVTAVVGGWFGFLGAGLRGFSSVGWGIWFLLLRVFWLVLPRLGFGEWGVGLCGGFWLQADLGFAWSGPGSKALSCWLSVKPNLYEVCNSRYHVSLYLWLIGSVLKHCKVPKDYDQDCRCFRLIILQC